MAVLIEAITNSRMLTNEKSYQTFFKLVPALRNSILVDEDESFSGIIYIRHFSSD